MANFWFKKICLFFILLKTIFNYIFLKASYKGRIKENNERSISGAVAIVTGANSGIGKEVAYEFAIRNSTVIMACRNLDEGNKSIEEHKKRAESAGIKFSLEFDLLHLDLLDFTSVRRFCKEVKSKYSKVDILVNNAGIFDTSGRIIRTKDGLEQHVAVNYLSPFLLTSLLLDVLKADLSQPSEEACRIIDVSSSLQVFGILADETNLMLEKPPRTMGYANSLPYGISKFYISLFSRRLSKILNEKETRVYSMCPGYVNTGMFRSFGWCMGIAARIGIYLIGIPPAAGCDTILYLALSKDPPPTGLFYTFNSPSAYINQRLRDNEPLDKKLWEVSKELVGLN